MGEVSVALKENGEVRVAHVHKQMLNAFQSMLWFSPSVVDHPLLELFEGANHPLAPHEYGLVIIDRDNHKLGSAQDFLNINEFGLLTSPHEIAISRSLDLAKELGRFPIENWPQLFSLDFVRAHLLVQAHEADAVDRVRVASWGDDSAAWESVKDLGLLTLEDVVNWVNTRRAELSGGKLMAMRGVFEFAPPGWDVQEYGSSAQADQLLVDFQLKG